MIDKNDFMKIDDKRDPKFEFKIGIGWIEIRIDGDLKLELHFNEEESSDLLGFFRFNANQAYNMWQWLCKESKLKENERFDIGGIMVDVVKDNRAMRIDEALKKLQPGESTSVILENKRKGTKRKMFMVRLG